jgi:hypothetical protein
MGTALIYILPYIIRKVWTGFVARMGNEYMVFSEMDRKKETSKRMCT